MDTYFCPLLSSRSASSTLPRGDISSTALSSMAMPVATLSALFYPMFDEETQVLLHPTPLVDLLMQGKPLTWSFDDFQFEIPDRFMSTRACQGVSRENVAPGHKQHHVSKDTRTELFASPWWAMDSSEKPQGSLFGSKVLGVGVAIQANYIPSSVEAEVQVVPKLMMKSMATQYEPMEIVQDIPRITVDSMTGTDEMERDLKNAAIAEVVERFVDEVIQTSLAELLASDTKVAVAVPLSPAVEDTQSPVFSSDIEEYEFVDALEVMDFRS